ncbi:MAG: type IX secretion system protein PorQ [Bacteroidetes bacterium]|nr:type IX secretion system protein PorQ [Bacteroidota bacterium]
MKSLFNLRYYCTIILFFALWEGAGRDIYAQAGGNNTYEFLNLTNPARVAALGGTLISVKDNDLNLSFQNPALLDSTMHNELAMSYTNYLADINYGYAAYSRTYKKIGSFSAGIQYLNYGDFTAAAVTGEKTGQFIANEYSLNLAYGRPIDSMFSVGATLKTIYSRLETFTSFGNAVDIAGVYNNSKHFFSTGLVIKNIGRQWKTYDVVHEPLPFEIQWGISKKLSHAPFRLNLTATHLEKWNLTYTDPLQQTVDPITLTAIEKGKLSVLGDKLVRHIVIGGEVLLSKNFHLRVGYNYQRRQELKLESHSGITGFSFGFGLKVSKFNLSYAYARYHMAGGPNHFTISTNFSEFYSKKK